jgi:hypothetical protein
MYHHTNVIGMQKVTLIIIAVVCISCGWVCSQTKAENSEPAVVYAQENNDSTTLTEEEIKYSLTDTIALKEVVVKASRLFTKNDGDGRLTTIEGTVLQNVGMLKDVLKFVPGVIVDPEGSIEVVGKGSPVVYINGRKVQDSSELDQLKSDRIKNIKVIRSPGARFDANAVIRITTVKNVGDGFALDTNSSLEYRDNVYGSETVNMNYRTGGLDVFSTLGFIDESSLGSVLNETNLWGQDHVNTIYQANTDYDSKYFVGKIGFNYNTENDHSFGAYYRGGYMRNVIGYDDKSTQSVNDLLISDDLQHKDDIDKTYVHLIDGYYSGMWGKMSAEGLVDILWRNVKNNQDVTNLTSGTPLNGVATFEKNNSRMIAGELNLSYPLWKGSLDFGGGFTNTLRDNSSIDYSGLIAGTDNHVNESTTSVYGELMQKFGNILVRAGLRYEHIDSRYYESGVKQDDACRKYNELIPSAFLSIPIKNTTIQLSYHRRYVRPTYGMLSSAILYINDYLYWAGNPFLKTSYLNKYELDFDYKWLTLGFTYEYNTDRFITQYMVYPEDPSITFSTKENAPYAMKFIDFYVALNPGVIWDVWTPSFSLSAQKPLYEVEYRNSTVKMSKMYFRSMWNNIITLPNKFMIIAAVQWYQMGDIENVKPNTNLWRINLAVKKTFNEHWDAKLSVNDIFNTWNGMNVTTYCGLFDASVDHSYKGRNFELTVGYRFNVSRSKYKGQGAGADERSRL